MRNCPKRLSSQRGEEARESTILQDENRRVSTSITRCGRDKNYLEIISWESGKNRRASGMNMLTRLGGNKGEQRSKSQTWKTKMWIVFRTCHVYQLRWCSLEMKIISQTVLGNILALKEQLLMCWMSGILLILIRKEACE
jgi:hypothetical protein